MPVLADAGTDQIRTFDAATGTETQLGFANAAGLEFPSGLALNAGVLYVANANANTIVAYNAATGAAVTSGFTAPSSPDADDPIGLAVQGTTLFVYSDLAFTVSAFDLATGAPVAGFTPPSLPTSVTGLAVFGNDLFVCEGILGIVSECDARTGAVINQNFITGISDPEGLAVMGNQLLVSDDGTNRVGAYGIPAVATAGNTPTSANPAFITDMDYPAFIAVVPEPGTWTLLGLSAGLLGLTLRRRARLG